MGKGKSFEYRDLEIVGSGNLDNDNFQKCVLLNIINFNYKFFNQTSRLIYNLTKYKFIV